MNIAQQRAAEVSRYETVYRDPAYGLGARRREHIVFHLNNMPRGSLLDVSTGRGEVLSIAEDMGFAPVMGTEAVPYLCDGNRVHHALAHALPFKDGQFDVVTMFDVMEHLLPEDTLAVCQELGRVASKRVLLTVHNGPSSWRNSGGELHINRRESYDKWHAELAASFDCAVVCHGMGSSISMMYEVLLDG